jgi:DNA-binding CsgD family transcriptional regulator
MVKARLGDGFGVEDIALQMKADVASIRFHVRKMREKGELAKMWQK